jgi:hypothetical protein
MEQSHAAPFPKRSKKILITIKSNNMHIRWHHNVKSYENTNYAYIKENCYITN